jgi:hypothetical protein
MKMILLTLGRKNSFPEYILLLLIPMLLLCSSKSTEFSFKNATFMEVVCLLWSWRLKQQQSSLGRRRSASSLWTHQLGLEFVAFNHKSLPGVWWQANVANRINLSTN